MDVDRRRFMMSGFGATVLARLPRDLFADSGSPPPSPVWDAGQVQHLLPTVSESEILIKASFVRPLRDAPMLRVGSRSTRGILNDTDGQFWQFRVARLQPAHRYNLSLTDSRGKY